MNKNRKGKKIEPLSVLYACSVYLFLYIPIFVVFFFSLNTSKNNITFEGFTCEWYIKMFQNKQLMSAFSNTIIVASVSTLVSVVIGTMCAVGLYKMESKLKSLFSNTLYIPIVIPEIVFGIALLIFFSSLNIETGMLTLILSHITFSMPFVVITVRSRMSGFDSSIEEAARDLGANEFRTFIRVTLPMIMPGVISGGMLALTISLDDVVISFFTTGAESTTLPLKILGMVKKGVSPDVNALSTMMILGTIVIMLFLQKIQGKLEKNN